VARGIFWARRAQWLLIPLLVLLGAESAARRYGRRWARLHPLPQSLWQSQARRIKPDRPLDYIFVGSSRVGCSIDADYFAAQMSRHLGRPAQAINFGIGYSQMQHHYLNLRNYFRNHPGQVRGCVVFIESAGAFPEPTSWQSPWCHPACPDILLPLLRGRDLPRLWKTQPGPERRRLVLAYLTGKVALLSNRQRIGNAVMRRARGLVVERLNPLSPPPPPAATAAPADLRAAGGVRTDHAGVAFARQLAISLAQNELRCQIPIRGWDGLVIADVVKLVRQAGGRVVFFSMPLHPVQAAALAETAVRRADHHHFLEKARAWGTPYIEPDIVTGDEDFPDCWHLRASRVAEYTRKLAEAWARASAAERHRLECRNPG
jgi:hypothetical protein